MWARPVGDGGCVALGSATMESCAPYPPREPRTRRRTVVTRSRRPSGCDPHQRPAPLRSRPNANFRKPPEMGRTRTGFSAANLRTSSVTLVRNPTPVTPAKAEVQDGSKSARYGVFWGLFLGRSRFVQLCDEATPSHHYQPVGSWSPRGQHRGGLAPSSGQTPSPRHTQAYPRPQ